MERKPLLIMQNFYGTTKTECDKFCASSHSVFIALPEIDVQSFLRAEYVSVP